MQKGAVTNQEAMDIFKKYENYVTTAENHFPGPPSLFKS